MEGRQRRLFTDEYKRQAVDLVASSGRSIGSVTRGLGLRDSVLRRRVEHRGAGREPTAASRCPTTQATLPSADHAAEIVRLRRENERLRMERDISKSRSRSLLEFRFIEDRRVDYPVRILCEVLEVSASGYYARRSRPENRRSAANPELVDDIKRVHRDKKGRYGSPRIHVELKAQGRGISRGRSERLMPYRVRTTDSRHGFPIAPNRLDRNFVAAAPNRVWLADITYVETDQGWLYLATVMDLYSRGIVGWAMADHLRTELALAALRMAIAAKKPGPGLIRHSDRGVRYASEDYRKVVQSAGLVASMSRKGDCYDNAPTESFFHTLKTELVHHRRYATRDEATRDIFAYIEGFYNRTRRHSAIGYISPIQMKLKAA